MSVIWGILKKPTINIKQQIRICGHCISSDSCSVASHINLWPLGSAQSITVAPATVSHIFHYIGVGTTTCLCFAFPLLQRAGGKSDWPQSCCECHAAQLWASPSTRDAKIRLLAHWKRTASNYPCFTNPCTCSLTAWPTLLRSYVLPCCFAPGCLLLSSFSFRKMLHLHSSNLDADRYSEEMVGYIMLQGPRVDSIPEIFHVVMLQTISQIGTPHYSSMSLLWRRSENWRSPGFHCAGCWPAQS